MARERGKRRSDWRFDWDVLDYPKSPSQCRGVSRLSRDFTRPIADDDCCRVPAFQGTGCLAHVRSSCGGAELHYTDLSQQTNCTQYTVSIPSSPNEPHAKAHRTSADIRRPISRCQHA